MATLRTSYVIKSLQTVMYIHEKAGRADGDILVFLTGSAEIEDACRTLRAMVDAAMATRAAANDRLAMVIYPIYAALDVPLQRAVFLPPPPGTRKVVLATK